MSRNLLYIHYVFTPKKRQGVIKPERERDLFAYIMKVTENVNAKLIRINAALDHIHILVKLPTTISVAEYAATVKRSSSIFIKETKLYPKFWGWAKEYSAESVSPELVPRIKNYIAGQKEHHKIVSFEEEWLSAMTESERAKWDNRFFDL